MFVGSDELGVGVINPAIFKSSQVKSRHGLTDLVKSSLKSSHRLTNLSSQASSKVRGHFSSLELPRKA